MTHKKTLFTIEIENLFSGLRRVTVAARNKDEALELVKVAPGEQITMILPAGII